MAHRGGGIWSVKLSPRKDLPGGLARGCEATGDLGAATLASMTLGISLGDDAFSYTGTWSPLPTGWYVDLPPA